MKNDKSKKRNEKTREWGATQRKKWKKKVTMKMFCENKNGQYNGDGLCDSLDWEKRKGDR